MTNNQIIKIQTQYGEMELHIPNPTGTTGHNEIKKGRGRPRKIKANEPIQFEPAIQEQKDQEPDQEPEQEMTNEELSDKWIEFNNIIQNQETIIMPDVDVLVHKKKRGRPIGSKSCKTQFKELYYNFL